MSNPTGSGSPNFRIDVIFNSLRELQQGLPSYKIANKEFYMVCFFFHSYKSVSYILSTTFPVSFFLKAVACHKMYFDVTFSYE